MRKNKCQERIGEININNFGSKMEIVQYVNALNITIQFEDGYISKNKTYREFKRGAIQSVYNKTLYNIGYLGEGEYKTKVNDKPTIQYQTWSSMFKRCYSEKLKNKFPTYNECKLCEEWYNFQNFAKWYDENIYHINSKRMCLDKDILIKGNKVYSPETCIFTPEDINNLFVKRDNDRGNYPIGVCLNKSNNKYISQCSNVNNTKQIYLGQYDTPEQAFNVYKEYKEKTIKKIANEYKDKIPQKLYEALYNYEVEITD